MNHALIGTRRGVHRLHAGEMTLLGLAEHHISAVHAWKRPDGARLILAGSYGDGLFRSEDEGETWTPVSNGLTAPAFRTIRPDPFDSTAILCGTEPARIFRSHDGGLGWQELTGIKALPGCDQWFLPYSPRAGAVRNIYSPPGSSRLLVSVEVGGLLDSRDEGSTWNYLPVLGDSDIHFVSGHPEDPDLLLAALGWAAIDRDRRGPDAPPLGGVACSRDGGQTWTKFHTDYTRAVIVPPTRPDLILAGPARHVGKEGRIEVSTIGGDTWEPATDGIDSPMEDMVELFIAAPDGSIWAMRSGGGLIRAEPGEWIWESILPPGSTVEARSVAFAQ